MEKYLKGRIIKPKNNINVRLTLDKEIQDSVESILHERNTINIRKLVLY